MFSVVYSALLMLLTASVSMRFCSFFPETSFNILLRELLICFYSGTIVVGTPGYVAPEVLRKEPYSFSCDLWSLGCIIYALLSGSLPFDHESQKETIKMTLENKLEFDLACWNTISDACKDILTRLLAKDPLKRISLDQALKHKWFNGIDLNQKTGLVNNKEKTSNFKQKKLNLSGNFDLKQ